MIHAIAKAADSSEDITDLQTQRCVCVWPLRAPHKAYIAKTQISPRDITEPQTSEIPDPLLAFVAPSDAVQA